MLIIFSTTIPANAIIASGALLFANSFANLESSTLAVTLLQKSIVVLTSSDAAGSMSIIVVGVGVGFSAGFAFSLLPRGVKNAIPASVVECLHDHFSDYCQWFGEMLFQSLCFQIGAYYFFAHPFCFFVIWTLKQVDAFCGDLFPLTYGIESSFL